MAEAPLPPPTALQGLTPDELADACGIEIADARRIVSLAHRRGELPERAPATIRRAALDAVRARCHLPTLEVVERTPSAVDPFVKYAFRLHDGAVIETVRIPLEKTGRFAVCVSSQAGCALACAFCATGRMGLTRNLETWEIVEQIRIVRRDLEAEHPGARVHGVVFQGMGEPLANADRVFRAIRVLCEPSAQAIDRRNITVCTAGLPAGIRRLAQEAPGARLGVSLGSVRPGARRALMPIDNVHPLGEVLAAAGEHARATGYAPMWAYTLLAGQNDADEDAAHLAALVKDFAQAHGITPRLSLIPFNSIGDDALRRSDRLEAFRTVLFGAGVGSIVRYSGGGDVGAACGQLARSGAPRRGARAPGPPGAPVAAGGARVSMDPSVPSR
ncbi:23S rRNA (adenine(2503)-C(2))-methyltransferase RlmN [Chondromyces crocatus]|uniref:RNA methyltransferase n=1 Tax=Chondromyces crocatus TaxID=52 RepID=A0A0K1EJ71_CHOCO|nr:radical SAM protein [Chondromyces crocatus]AKT40921.1 RNA methyltransferase [Chondromyces crocatus]